MKRVNVNVVHFHNIDIAKYNKIIKIILMISLKSDNSNLFKILLI